MHRRWWLISCLFLSMGIQSAEAQSPQGAPLNVAIDDNYPPYVFRDSDGNLNGYLVDIWALWERKTGRQVNLMATSWVKAQQLMTTGKADVIDTIFETVERKEFYDFTPPYVDIPVPIYVHGSIGGITSPKALTGFLVGVKAGDTCADRLQETGQISLQPFESYADLVQAAAAGSVRIFCLDEPPSDYLLYRSGIDRNFYKAFTFYSGQFHRAVRKGDRTLLEAVEQGFDKINDAERKALHDKWMGGRSSLPSYLPYVGYGFLVVLAIGGFLAVWVLILRHTVRRRTAELNHERDRIHTLYNTIPDLVWLKDPEGVFLSCNPAFEQFFGAPEAEIVGKTDADFVDAELAQFFRKADQIAIAAGKPVINEEWVTYASDGRQALLETIKTPMRDKNKNLIGVLGISRDITVLHKIKNEQTRLNRALRLLSDCNLTLVYAEDEFVFLSDVCRLVVEGGGYGMAWVGFAEHDAKKSVHPIAQCGCEDDYLESIQVSWDEAVDIGRGPTGTAIRTSQTQISQDHFTNPRMAPWRELMIRYGYKSNIGLPLIIREQAVGALSLYSTEPDAFSPQEVTLLEELARNLAFGVEALRMRNKNRAAQLELAIAATAFNSQESMVVTDASGIILRVNQAFSQTTGYTAEEAIGQTPSLLKSGRQDEAFYHAMWDAIGNNGTWQGEIWNRRKNGEDYLVWLTISAVKNHDGNVTNFVGTQFDITDRKKAEEKIQNLAFFDQLTGLPNRTLLLDRLKQAMTASSRSGRYCALLYIDLDDFKTINDALGHEAGDFVLKQVALRLNTCIREDDTVARLGGDEFLLMLVGLSVNETDAATQVEAVGEKILASLSLPHEINDTPHHCTPSIGVTLFKSHDVPVENLLKQADLAMYKAKAAGRNTIRLFDPEMETVVMARAALQSDLREAVRQKQFLLHYQPQIISNGQVTGAEALVRWQHPQGNMIPPTQFIPQAEKTDLILTLGEWVLETACHQLASWGMRPDMAHLTIAVNVSARQFHQPDFVERVLAIIDKTGANPNRLKLELTESMLIESLEEVIEKMFLLKAKGIGFSLDDFGTGYSSMAYLKRLPLDQLKIDQSFVRDVLVDPNDATIARTIVTLAQSLGLGVIAEGVETAEQRNFLANAGCHAYQGYFFSRPLPLEKFEQFVRQASSLDA